MVDKSFKAHYNHPYMNWGEVPLVLRDRWFLEFKRFCTWKPEYDARARRDYESKCAARLKDSINKADNVPLHNKAEYYEKLADYKKKEIAIDPNDVYLEVIGGQKKGKVYGLGSALQMYYKNPLSSHTSTLSATPSMISQLEEMKKMAQENQKMAEESLKLAKATDEKFETEKAARRKERIAMLDKLSELTTLIKNSYKCKSPFSPYRLS